MVALKSSGTSGSLSFGRARALTSTNLQEEKAPSSQKYYTILTRASHWSELEPYGRAARETWDAQFFSWIHYAQQKTTY